MRRTTGVWRLLIDPPSDGAWNMAVDEAILEGYLARGAEDRPPTVRLYAWNPPALSLGKSQKARDAHDPVFLRRHGIDLVRRPTGGLAVLHDDERTYSVVGSLSREPFRCGVLETYRRIACTLQAALEALGVRARAAEAAGRNSAGQAAGPSCFQLLSPHEINVDGRKLVGSAQLRRRRAFLQHGSIPLRVDPERLAGALGRPLPSGSFIDVREALGRGVSGTELDGALCGAFESTFGITLRRGELSDGEQLLATRLRCWKHDSVSWTLAGRSGRRERRWGPLG